MNSLFTGANPFFFGYMLMYLFWFVAMNRIILFWLYLWQLKEYHIGRFLDHFSTAKGKSLIWNYSVAVKLGTLAFYAAGFQLQFVTLAILLLAFEAALTAKGFFQRTLKHPVITGKTAVLIFLTHILAFAFAISLFLKYLGEMSLPDFSLAALGLLLFDLLAPVFISTLVLILQPITVLGRNQLIGKAKRRRAEFKNLTVVGITGSYGKSSTKELVAHLLSQKFKVAKTQANRNSEVGLSQTIQNEVKENTQILVLEMAGYNRGGIKLLCDIAKPQIGIISGINQQHMATFGSQQKIIDGKFELALALPENGALILNWDSEFVRQGYEKFQAQIKAKNIIWCSAFDQKDVWASDIKPSINNLSLIVNYKTEKIEVDTNARGAHNAQPILLAAASAISQGMALDQIKAALENYDFSPSGIKLSQAAGGINILESTYSANPDGVMAHLEYLKLFGGEAVNRDVPNAARGKKAIVMPCLIELGSSSKKMHFKIGQKIAQVCDLAIVVTGDRFNEIKTGATSAGMKAENIVFQENPQKIQKLLKNRLTNGDTILLEGRMPQPLVESVK